MDADARRPAEIKRWMEKWQDHCDTLDPQEDPDWAVAEFVADAIAQAVKERNERIADLKRSADASHLAASNECARANNATEIARQQAEEIVRYKKGCWEWPGKKSAEGYGQGRGGYAHRLAWQALNGPIPEGLQIDHLCRNRACVRPDHMELVTRKENILRGVSPQAINGIRRSVPRATRMT